MKVLHILNELKHSGAEVMLQHAFERFSSYGIESHILSTGAQVGDYALILKQTGYHIHHIPFRKSPMFFVELKRLLARERFHTVHLHTETAFIWYVLLLNMMGVRTVVKTFHNVFLFTGYLRWKRALQRKIARRLFHTIQHAISESVLEFEKRRFGNDCILIKNWTDTNKFRPPTPEERAKARSQYGIKPNEIAVVTVGACTPVKNHAAVLAAVKAGNEQLSSNKIIVLHAGNGPLLEEEKRYTCDYGVERYCRFLGALDDVRPCLHAADAFVMTSQWEGLGNAALEAMSTGLPAILYNVYGLKDLLPNDDGGLLICPKEDALTDALILLAHDEDLWRTKGERARQTILRDYSLDNSLDNLVRLYSSQNNPEQVTVSFGKEPAA